MAYSRFKVGADGKTPYERQKDRKCLRSSPLRGAGQIQTVWGDGGAAEIPGDELVGGCVAWALQWFERGVGGHKGGSYTGLDYKKTARR